MKLKENMYILFFAFAIFGVLVTIQIRSTVSIQRESAVTLDINRLKGQLDSKIQLGDTYKAQIEELENEKDAFLQAAPKSYVNTQSQKELEYLKLISGLTDVKGNGIIITLNDAENPDQNNVMDHIIHDSDILNVVNQLKIAGAQAISINNERIIATSEQVCSGPTVKINRNRYAVPYEIKAVGDADRLYNEMNNSEIINEFLELKKRVTLKKQDDITIPKFSNDINGLISKLEVKNSEAQKN